jgi:hypothetical protein
MRTILTVGALVPRRIFGNGIQHLCPVSIQEAAAQIDAMPPPRTVTTSPGKRRGFCNSVPTVVALSRKFEHASLSLTMMSGSI